MFESVNTHTQTHGRMDAGSTGILQAHLRAFGSDELKIMTLYRYTEDTSCHFCRQFHKLTSTETYLCFGDNFSFL